MKNTVRSPRRHNPAILGVLLISGLCATTTWASLPPGKITSPAGLQWYVRAAHNSTDDEYFIVYADGPSVGIHGFRVNASGVRPAGDPIRTIDTGPSVQPDIVYNPNAQQYLVVWSEGAEGDNGNIRGRFLDKNGNLLGSGDFTIRIAGGTQWFPHLAYNPINNVYMVVWTRASNNLGGAVGYQMVAADGTLLGSPVILQSLPSNIFPHSANVAWNEFTNKFFVAWTMLQGVPGGGEESFIRGQIFNGDGSASTAAFTIADFDGDAKLPNIAANSRNGEFLIGFDTGIGIRLNVWAMIFNSSGTVVKAPFVISSTPNIPDWRSHVAYNKLANTYLFTYVKGRACGTAACDDVLGRAIAPDGTLGPIIGIADAPNATDPSPSNESHGVDDGFGSWGGLIASANRADFFELYQIGSDNINGAIVSFGSAALTITTGSLPVGFLGVPYSADVDAVGGTPPYVFSAPLGLPPGLDLDPFTGAFTGTPTAMGLYNVRISVTDQSGGGDTVSKDFSLLIDVGGVDIARDMEFLGNLSGYYVLDGFGGIHAGGAAPAFSPSAPYFGFDIAKDLELNAAQTGAYILDGLGGVHVAGTAVAISPATTYFAFDTARGIELNSGNTGYYVLDGFGGVHAGGAAPVIAPATPYFGFNVAADIELIGAETGYYVLDGFGGVHAGGAAAPVSPGTPYFGFDIARDLELHGSGYFVLDGFGGVHASDAGTVVPSPSPPYFGKDAAIDLVVTSNGQGMFVLDRFGGVHTGGTAVVPTPRTPVFH